MTILDELHTHIGSLLRKRDKRIRKLIEMAADTDKHGRNVDIAKTSGATVSTLGSAVSCIPFLPVKVVGFIVNAAGGVVAGGADITKAGIESRKAAQVKSILEDDFRDLEKLNTIVVHLLECHRYSIPADFAEKLLYTYLNLNLNSKADRILDDFGNLINTTVGRLGKNVLSIGGRAAGKIGGRVISAITLPFTLNDLRASAKRLKDNKSSSTGDKIYDIARSLWHGFEELYELLLCVIAKCRSYEQIKDLRVTRGQLRRDINAARRGVQSSSMITQPETESRKQIEKRAGGKYFIYSTNDVFALIEESGFFSWAIFKLKTQPARHVGIVLMFNGKRCFSLNIRPLDSSLLGRAKCLTYAPAARSLEKFDNKNCGSLSKPVQTVDIRTRAGKDIARSIVRTWMEWKGDYSLRDYNCRDDTAACVMSACKIHRVFDMRALKEAVIMLNNTREDDRHYYRAGRIVVGRVFDDLTDKRSKKK